MTQSLSHTQSLQCSPTASDGLSRSQAAARLPPCRMHSAPAQGIIACCGSGQVAACASCARCLPHRFGRVCLAVVQVRSEAIRERNAEGAEPRQIRAHGSTQPNFARSAVTAASLPCRSLLRASRPCSPEAVNALQSIHRHARAQFLDAAVMAARAPLRPGSCRHISAAANLPHRNTAGPSKVALLDATSSQMQLALWSAATAAPQKSATIVPAPRLGWATAVAAAPREQLSWCSLRPQLASGQSPIAGRKACGTR